VHSKFCEATAMLLVQSSRDWNMHCTLPTHQRFLCSNKNTIASIQKLELKYSIAPNIDIWRKLDFCKWNQLITTQNRKTLCAFQAELEMFQKKFKKKIKRIFYFILFFESLLSLAGRSQAVGANSLLAGPPNLKCSKKI
jgi:hypothetical protein